MKIKMGAMRTTKNPYDVIRKDGWTWYILKHYESPAKEKLNPRARVHCFVISPFCPSGEYGDVYIENIGK